MRLFIYVIRVYTHACMQSPNVYSHILHNTDVTLLEYVLFL